MAAVIDEHTQWMDSGGKPLVSGSLYVGLVNADPVANPITIYSDSAFTTILSNPQTLDANGRSTNKIYVPGTFSLQVNNVNAGQEYQNLFNGTAASTGADTLTLTDISGANAITGSASTAITAYVANQTFVFVTSVVNTASITLNIDGVGAKSVVKNKDKAVLPGEFEANQTVSVIYNAVNDNFEWSNQNNKRLDFYEGTDVASAATTDIWTADGNTVHVTGTTGISSFGTAPNIGARQQIIFDDVVTLTNGANLALPGSVNYTTAAGDVLDIYADTTTQFDVTISKKDGSSRFGNVQVVNTQTGAVATGTTVIPSDDTIPQITEGDEYMTLVITPTNASNNLKIEVNLGAAGASIANAVPFIALFQDTTANALAATQFALSAVANTGGAVSLTHFMTAGTVSATTFRVRIGLNTAGTFTFNGASGARRLGGVSASSITITEIAA